MAQPSTTGSHPHFSSSPSAATAPPAPTPPGAYTSIFGGGPPVVPSPPIVLPAAAAPGPGPAPATPQAAGPGLGSGTGLGLGPAALTAANLAPPPAPGTSTPASVASSSNNTYIMPNSPMKNRGGGSGSDGYRPKVTRTLGQRPACLVNASVTYCGNNQIFAFGGFDQYTDEVYNHVLRLDLVSQQWSLVDNYGDIPGVRMGHTATLYQGDKLLVFGGENEHRTYLSDLIVFDLKTAHWTQPAVTGPIPKGRARHAAVLHEDKLFIIGGITGHDNYVLDDICYLDLKTFCWSRAWRFVGRFDHSAYIWGDRVWVFGGLSEDMDKVSDLWWLDLKGTPAFQSPPQIGSSPYDRPNLGGPPLGMGGGSSRHGSGSPRPGYALAPSPAVGASGYAANSRTAQVNTPSFQLKSYAPVAPGSISALKFFSGPNTPNQGSGIHFHVYSAGMLLDFVTPAPTIMSRECSLSTLDLATLRWQKLAEGREIFKPGYRWHYCTMNEDGTKAWLLGCPTDPSNSELGANGFEEYLSDIMEIDLRRYGFLGHSAPPDAHGMMGMMDMGGAMMTRPTSRVRHANDPPSMGLGSDLSRLFDQPPETGSGADFIVTAHSGNPEDDEMDHEAEAPVRDGAVGGGGAAGRNDNNNDHWLAPDAPTSPPIHVHRLILQARWPHFARLWSSQMAEFHTKKMHIPEPYSVVRAFLFYLYTDRIDPAPPPEDGPGMDIGGSSSSSSGGGSGAGTKRGRSPGDAGGGSRNGGPLNRHPHHHHPHQLHQTHHDADARGHHSPAHVTADLSDVAGLLVMSNIYNIPHLRLLCVNRLSKELDVEHACIIWHCASLANEPWLRKRAAGFCLTHWGRIVRSSGFLRLPRTAIVELSQEIDTEGRVIGGDELDLFGSALEGAGGVGGARFSDNGSVLSRRKESISSSHASQMAESEMEDDEEEGMDMN
ncbi:hypothetical protein HMPREF1624_03318 [Sporothrix schenckii ATCC 58251]|uniref:BTB domain-containing protein n=1 Tax=Sporothrix schenckii (strain ATCC 58251 / de Perez 2211183) TaxID=1391915 RepID=U7PZ17_SPOS1|nr:hypothetical protein HMPREF1624_03318 [Sporothrix schenckii ATCC 58251]